MGGGSIGQCVVADTGVILADAGVRGVDGLRVLRNDVVTTEALDCALVRGAHGAVVDGGGESAVGCRTSSVCHCEKGSKKQDLVMNHIMSTATHGLKNSYQLS
jgi:hypothetical protein